MGELIIASVAWFFETIVSVLRRFIPILMLQNGSQFVNGLTVGAHRTLDPSLNRGAVQILIN